MRALALGSLILIVVAFAVDAATATPWTVWGTHSAGDKSVPDGVKHFVTCHQAPDGAPYREVEVTGDVQDAYQYRIDAGETAIPCPEGETR